MSVDLEAGADVEALGEALGEAIQNLPEYAAYEAAEAAVKADDEAQARIDAFEQRRDGFIMARRIGEATQEDVNELRELQQALHELPVMQEFVDAQDTLNRRLAEVNEAVSRGLAVDFAGVAGSCCHDD